MTTNPGDGLRDLARVIEAAARAHPEWGRAHEVVLNCTGHLRSMAYNSDFTYASVTYRDEDGNELPRWPFKRGGET